MHVLLRGDTAQKIRIGSGLILFTFAATHFLNHAVGLVSLEMMQDVQEWRQLVTRSWPGTIILLSALVLHMTFALYKLAMRSTLRLPMWELIQLGLGLVIPFLLFAHIINTRIANVYFGVEDSYLYELARLWPVNAIWQSMLLLLVWLHGCIGIHFWMRLYRPYRAAQPILLFVAIAVPLAALAGFMVSGRAVSQLIEDPQMLAKVKEITKWPNAEDGEAMVRLRTLVRIEYAALLLAIAGFITWRHFNNQSGPKISISYVGGPTVKVAPGPTLLEISRMHKLPHASVCGGRARCSTCRVRIDEGAESLPAPAFPEAVTLGSISAPPNVRLACQVRPQSSITVTRLLRPGSTGPEGADLLESDSGGVERPMAVMMLDMRDFTRLSEKKLPYDVVFFLNEFFAATGSAINLHGGWIDKFLGDGLIAVFGQRHGVEAGCRQALRAARAIDLALDYVNAKLEIELGRPLQVGMGIDAGPLLLGRIGFGESVDLTVVGTAVNVASRLETLAKEKGMQIVLSRAVARYAGWEPSDEFMTTVPVRGVQEPIEVIGIDRGRNLPASILAFGDGEDEKTSKPGGGVGRRTANV